MKNYIILILITIITSHNAYSQYVYGTNAPHPNAIATFQSIDSSKVIKFPVAPTSKLPTCIAGSFGLMAFDITDSCLKICDGNSWECVTVGEGSYWNLNANGTGLESSPANNNVASGNYAIASGFADTASGNNSTISGGVGNTSSGYLSTVSGGRYNNATGNITVISGGQSNNTLGHFSTISGGTNNTANGQWNVISGGQQNITSGLVSTILGGQFNRAQGNFSTVGGNSNTAYSYGETVLGYLSTPYTPASVTSVVGTDRLFTVGNGTGTSSRSNAVTVLKNGNTGLGEDVPTAKLDVNGNARIRTIPSGATTDSVLTTDANGNIRKKNINTIMTASNGLNMVGRDIRLGGTLTQLTTVSGLTATNKMQFTGTGVDAFNVDGATFSLDALNNRVGINTKAPQVSLQIGNPTGSITSFLASPTSRLRETNLLIISDSVETSTNLDPLPILMLGRPNNFGAWPSQAIFELGKSSQNIGNANTKLDLKVSRAGHSNDGEDMPTLMTWVADNFGRVGIKTDDPSSAFSNVSNSSSSSNPADGTNINAKSGGSQGIIWEANGGYVATLMNSGTSVLSQGLMVRIAGNTTQKIISAGVGIAGSGNTDRFVVLANGNVGIGQASPSHPLHMGSGAHVTTAGVWTNASDKRLKSNIQKSTYGLKEVMLLNPVSYTMNIDKSKQVGLIAQEVQNIIPEVVSGIEGDIEKGETLGVSYGNLVPVLTKAIQEQQMIIENLQKENISIKAEKEEEINSLRAEIAEMESKLQSEIEAIKLMLGRAEK